MKNRDAYLDDDDDSIVKDGESVTVRMTMMDADPVQRAIAFDAANHRPHSAVLSDSQIRQRRAMRDTYLQRITTAWKGHIDQPDTSSQAPRARSIADARRAAYETCCQNLRDAWRRSPSRDAAPHDDPAAAMRSHLGGANGDDDDDDSDGNNNADRSYAQYVNNLQNAWRGSTNPAAEADKIQAQGMRWRGGR